MNELDVYLHSDRVGRLERLPGAKLRFTYETSWAAVPGNSPLSLSLPLREKPFDDAECRPFFSGLLPEGEFLKTIARRFLVSAGNPFALLAEIGGECAGAISLVAHGEEPPFRDAPPPQWLSSGGLALLLAELPKRPLLAEPGRDDEGIRLSLAGTQDKLPVLWRAEKVGITRGRPPSSHIIKAPTPSVEDMVANEAYCMALAAEAGLSVAEATPLAPGAEEGLLVRRYDRFAEDGDTVIRRIHQEDFCQALGIYPEEKYQAHGGPGVATCGALIQQHSAAPAPDTFAFLEALFFNHLIGNADAHAKNYSLLLDGAEAPRLAPLYDLLSTRVYGRRFNRKLAMKYGGEYRAERVRGRHLDRLAADLDLAPRGVRRRAADMVDRVSASTEGARQRLPGRWAGARVVDQIEENVAEMAGVLRSAAAEPA